jgi:hypothetical protein
LQSAYLGAHVGVQVPPLPHVTLDAPEFEQTRPHFPQLEALEGVSQPSFLVLALQSKKPGMQVGEQTPAAQEALEAFSALQVTPHAPQSVTVLADAAALPTRKSVLHSGAPGQLTKPGSHMTPPAPPAPPAPLIPAAPPASPPTPPA